MKPTEAHHRHETCLALFAKLSEYIDRELDAPTCQEIEAHINACQPCLVCLNTLKQTVALCRKLEHRQVPETFTARLKTAIADLMNPPAG